MPVIRLNSVVLPAPFGPMIALRSPGMIRNATLRVACRPPKLLHRPFSSSAATLSVCAWLTHASPEDRNCRGPLALAPASVFLFAVLTRREILAVHVLLEELVLAVRPVLADVRISLDHRVPEVVLVVAEHLLFLDFLDVDVLYRVAVLEADRPAHGIELET